MCIPYISHQSVRGVLLLLHLRLWFAVMINHVFLLSEVREQYSHYITTCIFSSPLSFFFVLICTCQLLVSLPVYEFFSFIFVGQKYCSVRLRRERELTKMWLDDNDGLLCENKATWTEHDTCHCAFELQSRGDRKSID